MRWWVLFLAGLQVVFAIAAAVPGFAAVGDYINQGCWEAGGNQCRDSLLVMFLSMTMAVVMFLTAVTLVRLGGRGA